MIKKKKTCSKEGCNYPIWSKGLCRQHIPKTPIKKVSTKQIEKNKDKALKTKEQFEFFKEIWQERPHYCKSCDKYLGEEPLSLYFDHLIEKNLRPELRFIKENIYICCGDCHSAKTIGYPSVKHKEAIENAKKILLS